LIFTEPLKLRWPALKIFEKNNIEKITEVEY